MREVLMSATLKIQLNGEDKDVAQGASVRQLLETLGIDVKRIAVEVNREVIRRKDHDTHVLNDGDVVEIVTFVGGG